MSEELDILGFDPSQLSVFSTNNSNSTQNKYLYTTRPEDSKSEDHVYRAKIKVIYSPHNLKNSILEVQSYAMQDENGYFTANSSLMIGDKSCPIFTAWKKCRYAEEGSVLWKQAAKKDDGGKQLFDKRFARYVTIQVLEDKNKPELEGQYLIWKLPSSIYDMIMKKTNPAKESGKCPVPVMDFLFGYPIEIEVTPGPDDPQHPERKKRETSYSAEFCEDPEPCTNPDKSSLLDFDEEEVLDKYVSQMKKVWKEKDVTKREQMLAEISQSENTKALRKIYSRVLDQLKEFCPDLNEEFGFKPWDEALTKRVQKWIDTVLSGNEPKVSTSAPAAAETAGTTSTATVEEDTNDSPVPGKDDDEDLPF
jgi:hypothetical protein